MVRIFFINYQGDNFMNKTFFITCFSALTLAAAAQAQYKSGGYIGNTDTAEITTVEQIKNLTDDTYVTMQGKITAKIGHEKYTFQDQTGSIKIEIDDDDWNGITVGKDDVVQIQGEVDKSWTKPDKIDVDFIQKLPSKQ